MHGDDAAAATGAGAAHTAGGASTQAPPLVEDEEDVDVHPGAFEDFDDFGSDLLQHINEVCEHIMEPGATSQAPAAAPLRTLFTSNAGAPTEEADVVIGQLLRNGLDRGAADNVSAGRLAAAAMESTGLLAPLSTTLWAVCPWPMGR